MRKLRSILCVFTIFALVVFCSCASDIDGYDKVISEIRDNRLVASEGGFSYVATSGEREKDYKVDGESGERTEYFIFTVEGFFATAPTCEFSIGEKKYSSVMQKHPFADSYSFEVGEKFDGNEITVLLKTDNEEKEVVLKTVKTEKTKSASFAFSVAQKELSSAISKHVENGKFDGEVYVRLVPNPTGDDGRYFWYVAFYKSANECYSVLIDSESGEVLASKKA